MSTASRLAESVVREYGRTYASRAGITLRDKPSPLYRLLVLATLLSTRISAEIAVAASRELSGAGLRTPAAMRASTWQERVDALGRAHYRRYDERTSTMLGEGAELIGERWHDDLRALRDEGRDAKGIARLLQDFPGIGPTGASIFLREVQGVWPRVAPYVDERAADGAARVGLPRSAKRLASYVPGADFPGLVAGLVDVALEHDADRVLERLGA